MVVLADGRILVAGLFTTLGGVNRSYLGRLLGNGGPDGTFNPAANNVVYSLAIQADGNVIAGGDFTILGGKTRNRLARLSKVVAANENLTFDSSSISWLRDGNSPEVWRTSFEVSTNSVDWFKLGAGERVPGGWELTGISLPPVGSIRARGFLSGGNYNGSVWFVEAIGGVPLITSQPVSRTNDAFTTATFRVRAGGTAPLSYQWRRGDVNLSNLGNVSGANTPSLTLSNLLGSDTDNYSVTVSNPYGVVTSLVARLTVAEPIITRQPVSRTVSPGQSVTLSVTAAGTAPLSYQWRKQGTNLSGATGPSLTFFSPEPGDAGVYQVVVSNGYSVSQCGLLRTAVGWQDSGWR